MNRVLISLSLLVLASSCAFRPDDTGITDCLPYEPCSEKGRSGCALPPAEDPDAGLATSRAFCTSDCVVDQDCAGVGSSSGPARCVGLINGILLDNPDIPHVCVPGCGAARECLVGTCRDYDYGAGTISFCSP